MVSILAIIFWFLIWSKVLVKEAGGWFSACANCWGDWSAHLTYITSFAYGHNWPLQLPIFSGHKFTYPFLIDLLSAALVKLGLDLPDSLILPGFVLSLVLTYLIYLLAKTLTASRRAAILTMVLFFFNAGWGTDSRFYNFITSQIIPQRGQLLGLSLSIIIYLLLWRKKIIWAGILAGLLPIIHGHSYLVTLMVGGWFGRKFFIPALVLGLVQIFYVYGFPFGRSFINFDTSWLKEWWRLGPVLPLFIWGLIKAPTKLKKFSLGFWLIFILANFFRFQPYGWDNSKLFLHWYLIASVGAALVLIRWKLIGLLLLLVIIFPGVRDVAKITQNSGKYQFFNNEQLELAEKVQQTTPAQVIFLTASNHNHWLPALTGRKIVMGYPGWLWTYGIDYQEREADVKKIYQSGDKFLLDKYKVNYVLIGPEERKQFSVNEDWFKKNLPAIVLSPDNTLYQYIP
jgi:hypothetical protein